MSDLLLLVNLQSEVNSLIRNVSCLKVMPLYIQSLMKYCIKYLQHTVSADNIPYLLSFSAILQVLILRSFR